MLRKVMAALVASSILIGDAAFARQVTTPPATPRTVEIAWDELAGMVVEKTITTVLTDGAKVQGEVLAVRPESLVLDIRKSSRKKVYPAGQAAIARRLVTEIQVIRHCSPIGRITLGILGAIGGISVASGLAITTDSAAILPGALLIIPVSTVAGYYAGKLADRRITRIAIRPEAAAAGSEEE